MSFSMFIASLYRQLQGCLACLCHWREHRTGACLGDHPDPKGRPCLYRSAEPDSAGHSASPTRGTNAAAGPENEENLNPIDFLSMQAARQNPKQILKAYSFSLDTAADSAAALRAACEIHGGQAPDAVFACAGSSKPMYFVEMEEEDLTRGMVNGYWVQAWTVFVRL